VPGSPLTVSGPAAASGDAAQAEDRQRGEVDLAADAGDRGREGRAEGDAEVGVAEQRAGLVVEAEVVAESEAVLGAERVDAQDQQVAVDEAVAGDQGGAGLGPRVDDGGPRRVGDAVGAGRVYGRGGLGGALGGGGVWLVRGGLGGALVGDGRVARVVRGRGRDRVGLGSWRDGRRGLGERDGGGQGHQDSRPESRETHLGDDTASRPHKSGFASVSWDRKLRAGPVAPDGARTAGAGAGRAFANLSFCAGVNYTENAGRVRAHVSGDRRGRGGDRPRLECPEGQTEAGASPARVARRTGGGGRLRRGGGSGRRRARRGGRRR
jgi:hypothetical protein